MASSRLASGRWPRIRAGPRRSTTSPASMPATPKRTSRSTGSMSAARPANPPATRSEPRRPWSCAGSSSRPTRACGGCSACSAAASRSTSSGRRPASPRGSSGRWAGTWRWSTRSPRPGSGWRTPGTRTPPSSLPPSSEPASATRSWRASAAPPPRRCGRHDSRSASCPATRWSTRARQSSRPRRRISMQRMQPRARHRRRRPWDAPRRS